MSHCLYCKAPIQKKGKTCGKEKCVVAHRAAVNKAWKIKKKAEAAKARENVENAERGLTQEEAIIRLGMPLKEWPYVKKHCLTICSARGESPVRYSMASIVETERNYRTGVIAYHIADLAEVPEDVPAPAEKVAEEDDSAVEETDEHVCLSCRWFETDTVCSGRCHRHAPVSDEFPKRHMIDYCGDHEFPPWRVAP